MNWLSLLLGLIRLATALYDWMERRRLIRAGEQAAINRQLRALAERTGLAKEIEEQVRNMPPDIVDAELEEWYRD